MKVNSVQNNGLSVHNIRRTPIFGNEPGMLSKPQEADRFEKENKKSNKGLWAAVILGAAGIGALIIHKTYGWKILSRKKDKLVFPETFKNISEAKKYFENLGIEYDARGISDNHLSMLNRIKAEIEPMQYSLIISNEKSAIGWLYSQLSKENGGPKTYAQIQPKFMQECTALDKREKMPELLVLLEENFLQDENGKWYIPDLTKTGDIAKLREKNLLKEFQDYLTTKGKLKVFRSEAIKAGFAKLWKDKDYKTIVDVAERLPEETIQEDSNLLMYYDISLSRV